MVQNIHLVTVENLTAIDCAWS